jgi:hypothetical protein
MNYSKLYNNLNVLYKHDDNITKLIEIDFGIFSENIIKCSPLLKLNNLVEKLVKSINHNNLPPPSSKHICINNHKRQKIDHTKNKSKDIDYTKLNKDIIKTNNWILFSVETQKKTELNNNFKNYCIETKIEPTIVHQQLITNNINVSKKQLKKQIFIYNKNVKSEKTTDINME